MPGKQRFDEFRELVLSDRKLQAKLRDITDRSQFIEQVVALAQDRGIDLDPSDVDEALRIGRTDWNATIL
jgi:hypothetical protein